MLCSRRAKVLCNFILILYIIQYNHPDILFLWLLCVQLCCRPDFMECKIFSLNKFLSALLYVQSVRFNTKMSVTKFIKTVTSNQTYLRNIFPYRGGAYRILVGKHEERIPLERRSRRCEDNIKMDLTEVGWGYRRDPSGSGW
jgi:hypothetical protein